MPLSSQPAVPGTERALTPTGPPSGIVYVGPSLGRSLLGLAAAVLTGRRP